MGFRLATHYAFGISGFAIPAFDRFGCRCVGGSRFGFTPYHAPHFWGLKFVVARFEFELFRYVVGLHFVLTAVTHHTVGL